MSRSTLPSTGSEPACRPLPRRALDPVLSRDFGPLLKRWLRLKRARSADAAAWRKLAQDIDASAARRARRAASVPEVRVDQSLPIAAETERIVAAIGKHQVLVIAGETGSGKTTQLPKLCLAAGRGTAGMIGCTQPRRMAARAVARRVAGELGTQVGSRVGFQVRFSEQVSEDSLIKFMTDGILLAETQSDSWLSAYDTIILDEAHERSLNIDFLLGYLKRLLARRRELKLIVTSATLDTQRFSEHFDNAPVIEVAGRAHPVEVRWRASEESDADSDPVLAALEEILGEERASRRGPGDVLVFLPGEREIRDTHRALARRQYRHTEILPLYARLSVSEQDRVFNPGPGRRVVLATNVAETSLTVPRIRYVIDTGVARVKRYSRRSQIERLHIEPISQAAADQRKGRCGRIGPGICYRLYGEDDYARRPRYTEPELLRSSLAGVILRMLALGLGEVDDFPFLDPPEPRAIADGYRRLAELLAIDERRRLTDVGRDMTRLPIDVQLARMLVEARALGSLSDMRVLVAFLSIQDPRERPADARTQADAAHAEFADARSDFTGILKLWAAHARAHEDLTQSGVRAWCREHFLSYLRMREWRELHRQLLLVQRQGPGARDRGPGGAKAEAKVPSSTKATCNEIAVERSAVTLQSGPGSPVPSPEQYERIHRAILAGLPTQVGHKSEHGDYRGVRQRRFRIFPGSGLVKSAPEWLLSAQILDLGGKVWAMTCARVQPQWIEQQAGHLLKRTWRNVRFSRRRGAVVADERVSLFGLVLVERRTVRFHAQDPALAHAIFLREALACSDLDARADFVAANARMLARARDVEARQRRQGLLSDEETRAAFFRGKLPAEISDARALDAWYKRASSGQQAAVRWQIEDVLEEAAGTKAGDFPSALDLGAQRLALEYRFVPGDPADGVTLRVPLALLNALPVKRCEWLVPGLLGELVAELIRALPRRVRRNFVPVPDFARAFLEAEAPRDQSPREALAHFLARTTGVDMDAQVFAGVQLSEHLKMRFEVIGEDGETLAAGRDLEALKRDWGSSARRAFSRRTNADLRQEDLQGFPADGVPREVNAAGDVAAFPALVDLGEAVALRVFEQPDLASQEHVRGVQRLLRDTLVREFRQAGRKLPIDHVTALRFAPMGSLESLREDLVEGGWRDLLAECELDVREHAAFQSLREQLGRDLFAAAIARLHAAEPIIAAQAELIPWLEAPMLGFARASYDDLAEQREILLFSGFLRELSLRRLEHYPRYLQAMRLRAERLRLDPKRDQQRMLEVQPYWREYLKRRASGEADASLEDFRWMVEELRVSLFAQELKTAQPVSAKRMRRALRSLQGAAP